MSLSLEQQLQSLPGENSDSEKSQSSFKDYVSHMSGSVRFDVHDGKVVQPTVKQEDDPFDDSEVREDQWTPKNSFLAESPYFHAFVEKEMHDLGIVTEVLTDIAERSTAFTKYGNLMADAGHRLAKSCRLRKDERTGDENRSSSDKMNEEVENRRHALGGEISGILDLLGEALDDIASAQLSMCKIIEETLTKALNAFVKADMRGVRMLKSEAESQTIAAEQMFFKYVTSKPMVTTTSNDAKGNNKPDIPPKKGFGKFFSRDTSRETSDGDNPALIKATAVAKWRHNLEEVRLYQATAELKRFQFTKMLVDVKNRRNVEICEGAVSTALAMQTYFHSLLDRMTGSTAKMSKIEGGQKELKKIHQTIEAPVWIERMNLIVKVLSTFQSSAAKSAHEANAIAGGDPVLIDKQTNDIDGIENEVNIWEVPAVLAKSSRYRRQQPPGVLHEGWLYQKNSSYMSMQQWTRRWFMLKLDGIYFLESSAELKKEKTGHSTSKVKICDAVLSTVREIPDDSFGRFRFELITPGQKPLYLMARGPLERQVWVESIRAAIEKQLKRGNNVAENLNQNIGKLLKDKRSTEIAMTVLKKDVHLTRQFERSILALDDNSESTGGDHNGHGHKSPLVKQVLENNSTCADCGSPSPDWVSLNLGLLVCLECSGVHRSLGVHVSKVRSLTLDSLSDSEARLFLVLGNDNANAYWEKTLSQQEQYQKPNEFADRNTREEFIKNKYLDKVFLEKEEVENNYDLALYNAVKHGDIYAAARVLAHGASVDFKNHDEGGRTPLHVCAVLPRPDGEDEWYGIECAELLIQHGAKLDEMDDSSHDVLDCALTGNADREMVEYLTSRLD